MIDDFAITQNMRRFLAGIEVLRQPIKGRIGIMLVYGPYGTGKTKAGQWFYTQNGAPYMRAYEGCSRRMLLSCLVDSLQVKPKFRSSDLFEQLLALMDEEIQPIIIDEADYLISEGIIETVRDISDMTNAPIVLMGMENFEKDLKAYPHIIDRVTVTVKFELFNEAEIAEYAERICEVKLSDDAISFIRRHSQGRLRMTTTWLQVAERIAKGHKLEEITAAYLQAYQQKERSR